MLWDTVDYAIAAPKQVQIVRVFSNLFYTRTWNGHSSPPDKFRALGQSLVRGRRLSSGGSRVRIPLYSRHVVTLGKSFTRSCLWRFGVKLRHSFRAVLGAPLSGLKEAL